MFASAQTQQGLCALPAVVANRIKMKNFSINTHDDPSRSTPTWSGNTTIERVFQRVEK